MLDAYDYRCAVIGCQLNLVDAAHIIPVSEEQGNDSITNGIALSPTVHRAFDNGLIFLDTSYFIKLNRRKVEEYENLGICDGLDELEGYTNGQILLPAVSKDHPNPSFIETANKLRGIPGF